MPKKDILCASVIAPVWRFYSTSGLYNHQCSLDYIELCTLGLLSRLPHRKTKIKGTKIQMQKCFWHRSIAGGVKGQSEEGGHGWVGEKRQYLGKLCPWSLISINSHRSSVRSSLLEMHTGHSVLPHHSERTGHDTGPLAAVLHVHTQSSSRSPCWWRKPVVNCRSTGCSGTACMAGEQNRVWCMDTAPLCNQEAQAQLALSLHLVFRDAPLAEVGPAAGRFQAGILGFQNL